MDCLHDYCMRRSCSIHLRMGSFPYLPPSGRTDQLWCYGSYECLAWHLESLRCSNGSTAELDLIEPHLCSSRCDCRGLASCSSGQVSQSSQPAHLSALLQAHPCCRHSDCRMNLRFPTQVPLGQVKEDRADHFILPTQLPCFQSSPGSPCCEQGQ